MYDDLVRLLKNCSSDTVEDCVGCPYQGGYKGTYCMNGLISEAADAIEELQSDNSSLNGTVSNLIQQIAELSKPRWIPVTERLPEIKEHHVSDAVLVYLDDGGMAFSELEENIFGQVWFDLERPSPDGESDCTVTHWMQLPEPPKEVDT